MATAWQLTTSASPGEVARRLSALCQQAFDPARSLYVWPNYPREVTESNFRFVCSKGMGPGCKIWCAGKLTANATGTAVQVRQWATPSMFIVFGLLAVIGGALLGWGLWPVGVLPAVGVVIAVGLFVVAFSWLVVVLSKRWTRRKLQAILMQPVDSRA